MLRRSSRHFVPDEERPYLLHALAPKGFDIRATVIGAEVFAARIASQTRPESVVVWRRARPGALQHEVEHLPSAVSERCVELCRHYGLAFGGHRPRAETRRRLHVLRAQPQRSMSLGRGTHRSTAALTNGRPLAPVALPPGEHALPPRPKEQRLPSHESIDGCPALCQQPWSALGLGARSRAKAACCVGRGRQPCGSRVDRDRGFRLDPGLPRRRTRLRMPTTSPTPSARLRSSLRYCQ